MQRLSCIGDIQKGSSMSVIDDSLVIVGNDSIRDLYKFVEKRQELATESDDFVNWLMYTRIQVELALAITSYTGSEERKCRESEN